ncbi:TPA: type IV secretion system protein VirB3 [Neisseria meningitidis]
MQENNQLNRAIVYKGCTRPAMLFGVPIIPFLLGVGGTFLFGFMIEPPFALLAVITWWGFKELCKNDELFFHSLYIKMITKMGNGNSRYWKATTFQPIDYRKDFNKRK